MDSIVSSIKTNILKKRTLYARAEEEFNVS